MYSALFIKVWTLMLALNGLRILLQHENRGKCVHGALVCKEILVKVQVSVAALAD